MAARRSFWQSFNTRTFKYGSHASLFTLLVLGVVVILYAMMVNHNQRFDVTRSKRFTLVAQSIKLLQNLQQPIKVIGFFQLPTTSSIPTVTQLSPSATALSRITP
jgi:ABC-type uncharacterized transport system involved in gliding motility auxiliary subunit